MTFELESAALERSVQWRGGAQTNFIVGTLVSRFWFGYRRSRVHCCLHPMIRRVIRRPNDPGSSSWDHAVILSAEMPDLLSGLPQLKVKGLPSHLKAWEAGGRKAYDLRDEDHFPPETTEIKMPEGTLVLPGWLCRHAALETARIVRL